MDARKKYEQFKANLDEDEVSSSDYAQFLLGELSLDERLNNLDVVADVLAKAGYSTVEYWGGSQFGTASRELAELYLQYGNIGGGPLTVNSHASSGVDLDAEFKVAAEAHNIPVMKLLYQRGCSIDGLGDMKDSALHEAARLGDHELSEILINDFGFDPLLKNAEGRSPYDIAMDRELYQAAARGDLEAVNQLVDEGYPTRAAVNEYRGEGYYYGSFEHGVPERPLYRDRPLEDMEPAWKSALDNGHVEVFMAIINSVGPSDYFLTDSQEHKSALRCAIEAQANIIAIELLEQGANIHSPSQEFHLAVSQADTTLSEKMLSLGADVHRQASIKVIDPNNVNVLKSVFEGPTPLHCAGSAEQVRLLIENGADVNSTVIGDAILNITYNAGVGKSFFTREYVNHQGVTPLHSAHSPEVALELLNAGANSWAIMPSTMNDIHQNPSMSHRMSGRDDIADAIDSFVQKQALLNQLTNTPELKDEQPRMRRKM